MEETKKQQKEVKMDANLIRENIKKASQGLTDLHNVMKALDIPEEILEREIKPFGNASHIILPKEYSNKTAKVIIKK